MWARTANAALGHAAPYLASLAPAAGALSRMIPRGGGPVRFRRRLILALAAVALLWIMLPYDNVVVLVLRWHGGNLWRAMLERAEGAAAAETESWLYPFPADSPPPFPVDFRSDVGIILKTGWGTRKRLPAWFEAFEDPETSPDDVLVVADFPVSEENSTVRYLGRRLEIHDAVDVMDWTGGFPDYTKSERLWKHHNMTTALAHGKEGAATMISRDAGWSMDAMKVSSSRLKWKGERVSKIGRNETGAKRIELNANSICFLQFVPALHMFETLMPAKKWYILVDDDTYLVKPSLQRLLEYINPRVPHYIGNAVGDFRARFAHGGSAIILSAGALDRIAGKGAKLRAEMYRRSLTETWGDRLLAMTAMQAGVYLEERYNRFFNGEPPRWTRLLPAEHKWCSPLVSFHGLAKPEAMREVGTLFAKLDRSKPLRWVDLWAALGADNVTKFSEYPVHHNWDHVGGTDERTLTERSITSAQACQDVCLRTARKGKGGCLAWTWIEDQSICNVSPWMSVGEEALGRYSGINVLRVRQLMKTCIGD